MPAVRSIDLSGTGPARQVSVDLGGEQFDLRVRWNDRAQRWVLDCATSAGVRVAMGIALVTGKPIWSWLNASNRPQAEIVCVDTTRTGKPIGFDDLSNGRIAVCVIEAS